MTPRRKRRARASRRQAVMLVCFLCVIISYAGVLVYKQGIANKKIAAQGVATRMKTENIPAQRGDILTADGQVLATSVQRYHVVVDQKLVPRYTFTDKNNTKFTGVQGAAQQLATDLGKTVADTLPMVSGKNGYYTILASATPEQWSKIQASKIDGVTAEPIFQRIYPNNTLAGNLVGYTYNKGNGTPGWTGLESTQNTTLSGKNGDQSVEIGGNGIPIPDGTVVGHAATAGCSVTLTLNADIQYQAEQLAAEAKKSSGSTNVSIVVTNVKTGAVVAMADSVEVNPGNVAQASKMAGGSPAASLVYPPGSTAKVITMAGAIQSGNATPTSQYSIPYSITVSPGVSFHDDTQHGIMHYTLTGILAYSSNVGAVTVGSKMDYQGRYDYLSNFGFGHLTGIEIPGESAGILWKPTSPNLDGNTKFAVLFGQGVSVTAVQATQVFATLGNGGVQEPLHIVAGTTCPGKKYVPKDAGASKRIVSQSTAQQVVKMMESVVGEGTGTAAQIPDYTVAGKTGTSQVIGTNGQLQYNVASFIGVAPAENPQYAVSVVLQAPKSSIFGGTVAAPVFKQVMTDVLQKFNVPPSPQPPPAQYPVMW